MNKRMIILIALVAMVSLMPASAETLEVRGTIIDLGCDNPTIDDSQGNPLYVADAYNGLPGLQWDYRSFSGFWYDPDDNLQTETLTILSKERYSGEDTLRYYGDREIGEGSLIYTTHTAFREYELYTDKGLTVGGDTGYYLEGWMGEKYVAVDNNADELCELLVDDDKKTLSTGEEWNLGGEFAIEVTEIDATGEKATIHLSKNGDLLATGCLDTSGSEQDHVYTYTADIGRENNIPVFSCYVNAISNETDTVELMYVFLIDDDVIEIKVSQTYGAMEVMTTSSDKIVLNNDETTIDVDTCTTEPIMSNMYFKTADDDVNDHIRFYPYVEYTEPGAYEVRGTIMELDGANATIANSTGAPLYVKDVDKYRAGDQPGLQWDYSSFAGFWYDLDEDLKIETLAILSKERDATEDTLGYPGDREIGEGSLIYTTHPVFQEYELHQDIEPDPARTQTSMEEDYKEFLERGPNSTGLCVESDNAGGDCGYFIEGWMGEEYVAIDGNADKLCKLLLEFEDDDKKILTIGKEWDLGGGFALEVMSIDDDGNKVMLQLFKNNVSLDMEMVSTGGSRSQERVYTYTPDIGGEKDIPVFSCYVDAIFKGSTSYVQLMYVFLIDDDVLEIKTSRTYGAMEVMTANSNRVILRNDETTIDLDPGTTENITDNMYFKIADDDTAIRFYPFVERTIGGEEPTPPPATIPATDSDHDGVPDVWDADNSTPSGYWVNSDGIGRKWGDMNGDGELTSADALMILQAAVGKIELG